MINKPEAKALALRAEELILQYKDGLLTENEWVAASINLYMKHYSNMRVWTLQEAMQWQPDRITVPE